MMMPSLSNPLDNESDSSNKIGSIHIRSNNSSLNENTLQESPVMAEETRVDSSKTDLGKRDSIVDRSADSLSMWLSEKSKAKLHLVMEYLDKTSGKLQNNRNKEDSFKSHLYDFSSGTDPLASGDGVKNCNVKQGPLDQSPNYKYTIDPEKMVSTICSSSPISMYAPQNTESNSFFKAKEAAGTMLYSHLVKDSLIETESPKLPGDNENSSSLFDKDAETTIQQQTTPECLSQSSSDSEDSEDLIPLDNNTCYGDLPETFAKSADYILSKQQSSVQCQTETQKLNREMKQAEKLIHLTEEIAETLTLVPPSQTSESIAEICLCIKNYFQENLEVDQVSKPVANTLIHSFLHISNCWMHLCSNGGLSHIMQLFHRDLGIKFRKWETSTVNLLEYIVGFIIDSKSYKFSESCSPWNPTHFKLNNCSGGFVNPAFKDPKFHFNSALVQDSSQHEISEQYMPFQPVSSSVTDMFSQVESLRAAHANVLFQGDRRACMRQDVFPGRQNNAISIPIIKKDTSLCEAIYGKRMQPGVPFSAITNKLKAPCVYYPKQEIALGSKSMDTESMGIGKFGYTTNKKYTTAVVEVPRGEGQTCCLRRSDQHGRSCYYAKSKGEAKLMEAHIPVKMTPVSQIEQQYLPSNGASVCFQHVSPVSVFMNPQNVFPVYNAVEGDFVSMQFPSNHQGGTSFLTVPSPVNRNRGGGYTRRTDGGIKTVVVNKRVGNNGYVHKTAAQSRTRGSKSELFSIYQVDESDSSDESVDAVYMKPGSYDVPLKNGSDATGKQKQLEVATDSPAADDQAWKAACASAGTLSEMLRTGTGQEASQETQTTASSNDEDVSKVLSSLQHLVKVDGEANPPWSHQMPTEGINKTEAVALNAQDDDSCATSIIHSNFQTEFKCGEMYGDGVNRTSSLETSDRTTKLDDIQRSGIRRLHVTRRKFENTDENKRFIHKGTGSRGSNKIVWYSRPGLSQAVSYKLQSILNSIWNMDGSEFIKYPYLGTDMTDRDKTNNMVLQTMAYKLKNHFYESIDQFVEDFRKIFYNSKLNNSEDNMYSEMACMICKKFDNLLEEHFSDYNFNHISGSTGETNPSDADHIQIPSILKKAPSTDSTKQCTQLNAESPKSEQLQL